MEYEVADGTMDRRGAATRALGGAVAFLLCVAPIATLSSYVGASAAALLANPFMLAVLVSGIGILLGQRWARTLFFYAAPLSIVTAASNMKQAAMSAATASREAAMSAASGGGDAVDIVLRMYWPRANLAVLLVLVLTFVAVTYLIYRPRTFGASDVGSRRRRRSLRFAIVLGLLFVLAGVMTFAYASSNAALVLTPLDSESSSYSLSTTGVDGGIFLTLIIWSYGLGSVAARFPTKLSSSATVPTAAQTQEARADAVRMAKAGFCSECRANVWLANDGECECGHAASCISNVYDAERAADEA